MGRLTTHVLDTALGRPAVNLRIELHRIVKGDKSDKIVEVRTNADGRCDAPLIDAPQFETGVFELKFYAGEYFDRNSTDLPSPKFLDEIIIRFGIADVESHYHVPLLLSPYGYSTYRGS